MHESAGGIGPTGHACRTEAVGRVTVKDQNLRVEVRIPRENLSLAIHEELIGGQIVRHLSL